MQKLSDNYSKGNPILRNIIPMAIIGGALGAVIAYLYEKDILINLQIGDTLRLMPFSLIVDGAVIGILCGIVASTIKGLFALQYKVKKDKIYLSSIKNSEQIINEETDKAKLTLKREELDITKNKVKIAEVSTHKEVLTEEKNIKVPITREELVIETKILKSDNKDMDIQAIRIPISEEKINVSKQKVDLEDVSIYNDKVIDIKHLKENVKQEELKIKNTGKIGRAHV
jgi:uncharacterized protein (TIGR02271 family)